MINIRNIQNRLKRIEKKMDPPEDMEQDPFLRQWLAAYEATKDN